MTELDIGIVLDGVVAILLAVTIGYCAFLYRRLAGLRAAKEDMAQLVVQLNTATGSAHSGILELKSGSKDLVASLQEEMSNARALIDELSVVNQSGQRLAERIENGLDSSLIRGGDKVETLADMDRARGDRPHGQAKTVPFPEPSGLRSEAERELVAALRQAR